MSAADFNPESVNLVDASDDLLTQIACYTGLGDNEYNGMLGARISSLFVIGIVSSMATFFPVLAARSKRFRVPVYFYLFARYFGAGVIVATAFIHLLDPAYDEIGPATCVGMTGGWAGYSWPPAIAMASAIMVFLMDFGAERYVETKYDFPHDDVDLQNIVAADHHATNGDSKGKESGSSDHRHLHSADQSDDLEDRVKSARDIERSNSVDMAALRHGHGDSQEAVDQSFRMQIAAFLILEFGVVFHSVIIGLNLGTAGDEFATLYVVLVFHQSFEGLGIGARLSAIPIPARYKWLPYALCAAYGLTTPIAIAIGLGLRTTYNPGSFTANVVSGVLDSISAGILLWTGLVELLARDFLFDPRRSKDNKRLAFMVGCTLLGIALMSLLGKWA